MAGREGESRTTCPRRTNVKIEKASGLGARVTRLGGLPPWLSVRLSVPRRVDAPASARAGVVGG